MISWKASTTFSVSYRRPFWARTSKKFFVRSEGVPSFLRRSFSPAVFSCCPRVGFARNSETWLFDESKVLRAPRSFSTAVNDFSLDFTAAEKSAPAYLPARPGGVMGGCIAVDSQTWRWMEEVGGRCLSNSSSNGRRIANSEYTNSSACLCGSSVGACKGLAEHVGGLSTVSGEADWDWPKLAWTALSLLKVGNGDRRHRIARPQLASIAKHSS